MDNLRPGQIVTLASGAVTLLFSFFAFVKFDVRFGDGESYSAWSRDVGFLPLATLPALIGLVVAGGLAASIFGNAKLPAVLGFTTEQLFAALSFIAALTMVGYLIMGADPYDFGIGFWFMLLGSIGLVVGSVMELTADGASAPPSAGPANQPPSPF